MTYQKERARHEQMSCFFFCPFKSNIRETWRMILASKADIFLSESLLITSFSALISSILDTKKACLAIARFYKMYQCQYRCEVDSNTCIYAGEFSCSQNNGNMILPV